MEKNVAYGSIQLNEAILENTYEQPELPMTSEVKKTESFSAPEKANDTRKRRYCFNVFITIFTVITLVLTLTCLIILIIQHSINQPQERQQDDAIKTLQILLNSLNQEFQALKQQLINDHLDNETPHTTDTTTKPRPSTDPQPAVGSFENPASSCRDIPQDRPSGEYYIQTGSNPPIQVYCDTSRTSCSCNTTGGWMRVANIDMTDPNQQCPDGFRLINRTEQPLRTCGRPDLTIGCISNIIPAHGIEYSQVCGRIVGYQVGSLDAFYSQAQGIDSYYFNGISLTHGQSPRQHIWSFVGAIAERYNRDRNQCPCTKNSDTFQGTVPSFVGTDYFCDTAIRGSSWTNGLFYPNDPLWDGQGCGSTSTCCEFNNPPWFCKQFPQPTTDDIELRICNEEVISFDDSPFEVVEIFVK